jgi:hypothetical protein
LLALPDPHQSILTFGSFKCAISSHVYPSWPCYLPKAAPALADPPWSRMTISHRAPYIDSADSVLPDTSPFAKGVVVKASRSYRFPPDTTITEANGLLIVRAYRNLYVIRASQVTVRQRSSAAPLSHIDAETNEGMVAGILSALPNRTLLPNDACRDCVVPVARGV